MCQSSRASHGNTHSESFRDSEATVAPIEDDPPPHSTTLPENPPAQVAYHGNDIELWQAATITKVPEENDGVVARLLRACIDLMSYALQRNDTLCSRKRDYSTLQRYQSILKLWAEGHHAWNGGLDNTLERSKDLQHTTMTILSSLCRILSKGLSKHAATRPKEAAAVQLQADIIYSQTKWLLMEPNESASDSDSETDSDASIGEIRQSGIGRLVEDIKTHIDCLVDLNTVLEYPAVDPEPEEEPRVLNFEQRTAKDYHADLILAKFPKALTELVECLGRISWERYQRIKIDREINTSAGAGLNIQIEEGYKYGGESRVADSNFRDSGIGQSLALPFDDTETMVSFMTSIGGGSRVKIPSLPQEARNGARFECNACGKLIRALNNREWRKHLFLDLQPYTCFFASCAFSSTPFASRQLWSVHLELDHNFGPDWASVICPLCLESTDAGKSKVLIHFARHMEDVALAALPREIEPEDKSGRGSSHSIDSSAGGGQLHPSTLGAASLHPSGLQISEQITPNEGEAGSILAFQVRAHYRVPEIGHSFIVTFGSKKCLPILQKVHHNNAWYTCILNVEVPPFPLTNSWNPGVMVELLVEDKDGNLQSENDLGMFTYTDMWPKSACLDEAIPLSVEEEASSPSTFDRWEVYKPILEVLYLQEGRKLSEVVLIMKEDHNFNASLKQYKYHFRKWDFHKRITRRRMEVEMEMLDSYAKIGAYPGKAEISSIEEEKDEVSTSLEEDHTQVVATTIDRLESIFLLSSLYTSYSSPIRKRMNSQGFVDFEWLVETYLMMPKPLFEAIKLGCIQSKILEYRSTGGWQRVRAKEGWDQWVLPPSDRIGEITEETDVDDAAVHITTTNHPTRA